MYLADQTDLRRTPYSKLSTPQLRESQARKEEALARIKEIEAQEKEESVVSKEAVNKANFKYARQARDAMLTENNFLGQIRVTRTKENKWSLPQEGSKNHFQQQEMPLSQLCGKVQSGGFIQNRLT